MNTSMGFWDSLFGERVTIDLPLPDGTTKKVSVTRAWLAEMMKQGKIREVSLSVVKVNILEEPPPPAKVASQKEIWDALNADFSVKIESWRIGTQLPRDQYERFVDSKSGEVYAIRKHDGDGVKTVVVQRHLWEHARQAMEM